MKSMVAMTFGLMLLLTNARAEDPPALTLDKTIPLPLVEGRIDHMAADVAGQRLFVAALGNNSVEVIDLKAGTNIQSLAGFAEPQGIAYVPELHRLFVANRSDGTCRIIDAGSFNTINTVKLGEDADNVRYDAVGKRIYVGCGAGALAVIDPNSGKKVADIKLAGHPESFQLASAGPKIFVNVPGAGHVAVVDRDKESIIATWPLQEARANFPMALDASDHRLFIGCRNPATLLVLDDASGRTIASVPISRDTDDVFYDSRKKLIYVSCGGGTIDVIRQADADYYTVMKPIVTVDGARTCLFIPELKLLCLAAPHRGNLPAQVRTYRAD